MKIAGCVVLYNPPDDCIGNIETYIGLVDVLFVMDNSTKHNAELISSLKQNPKIEYTDFNANTGIAYALKIGVGKAVEKGYDLCLTMDQDSRFPLISREELYDRFASVSNLDDYGIIGLNFNSECKERELKEVKTWITSGNFIVLECYKKIKGFNADLFIDYVDFELNEQFYNIGKKIAVWQDWSLEHKIGNPERHSFFLIKFTVMNHSPIRLYYRYRNSLFLFKKNKRFYKNLYYHNLFIDIPKILLFETDRKKKLRMIKIGRRDAKLGNMGAIVANNSGKEVK